MKISGLLIYILVATALCCLAKPLPAAISVAWWVTAEYTPVEDQVEGLKLAEIDKTFSKVLVLTRDNILPDKGADVSTLEKYDNRFSWEGDFDRNGLDEKIIVGVYLDKKGKTGRFILVLERRGKDKWKKIYLGKLPGKPGFSVLTIDGKWIKWAFCLGCDDYYSLLWDHGRYELK